MGPNCLRCAGVPGVKGVSACLFAALAALANYVIPSLLDKPLFSKVNLAGACTRRLLFRRRAACMDAGGCFGRTTSIATTFYGPRELKVLAEVFDETWVVIALSCGE